MTWQALARKWRPRSFGELVGQEHVVRPLANALEHQRLHHAFLFTGTRGVGKTTIARILARCLNCETGVTATPCGECGSCREIDEGRFPDLIEVDAASRTKIDQTRELLDNVPYAPARGRYKVYLVDEVHMLSGHSFNALLKTLEEPPSHVKFLLATTDPQKLPVTVLSRCLQFHLRRLDPGEISARMAHILGSEGVAFDAEALPLIALAADGSLRDGLSLLDQAVAWGGGRVGADDVRSMLGTVGNDHVEGMLNAIEAGDAAAAIRLVREAWTWGAQPEALLDAAIVALHGLALAQVDPLLIASDQRERLIVRASRIDAARIQLYYQLGVSARRDVAQAPDPRAAVEMAFLRMIAFAPDDSANVGAAPPIPVQAAIREVPPSPFDWRRTSESLSVTGLVRELAANAALESFDGKRLVLVLDASRKALLRPDRETALRQALTAHLGASIVLEIRVAEADLATTPAAARAIEVQSVAAEAESSIRSDPFVQGLQARFGARIPAGGIRPRDVPKE